MDFKRIKYIDKPFVLFLFLLIAFGLIVLVSATEAISTSTMNSFLLRQIVVLVGGLVVVILIIRYDYLLIRRFSWVLYGTAILLLFMVLFFGQEMRGTNGWLKIGPLPALQVAEITKILLILAFANFLNQRRDNLHTLGEIMPCIIFMGIPFAMIIMQPDLGTALVYIAFTVVMMFFAGADPKRLGALIMAAVLMIALVLFLHFQFDLPLPLKNYQIQRLTIFIDPYNDGLGGRGAGWNTIQSLVAIGSGGFSGRGLFQGTQVQLNFLPEHHTDFIYAVIGEELGFIGAFAVIIIYMIILIRTLLISFRAKDLYGSLLVIGISAMWLFHIFENIGMSLGVMPITGIPLPFISYGGSSMLTNLVAVGLILSVNIRGNRLVF
ncbi:MAG: rod shape-determining protein RodA [Syntrophomonadaceae bacterium]|nr:rod shape-determining protein RodA [Syntrophomonadaceae bacterium]